MRWFDWLFGKHKKSNIRGAKRYESPLTPDHSRHPTQPDSRSIKSTMNSDPNSSLESEDSAKVDEALEAIRQGDLQTAEMLLQQVIANTPSEYQLVNETERGISVNFLNREAFFHYVMWKKQHGEADQEIIWQNNPYVQAHFYLGFLLVKQDRCEEAIKILDEGQKLEPENPRFTCEKAIALMSLDKKEEALSLYESISEIGPFVSAVDLACALRGRGCVCIEMGDLDQAERLYKESLTLDSHSEMAKGQLQYISHVQSGGVANPMNLSERTEDSPRCEVCSSESKQGVLVPVGERHASICNRCYDDMMDYPHAEENDSSMYGLESVDALINSIKYAAEHKDKDRYLKCLCWEKLSVEQKISTLLATPGFMEDTLLEVRVSPFRENRLDAIEDFEFNAEFEGLLELTYKDSGDYLAPYGKHQDRFYLLSIVPAE